MGCRYSKSGLDHLALRKPVDWNNRDSYRSQDFGTRVSI